MCSRLWGDDLHLYIKTKILHTMASLTLCGSIPWSEDSATLRKEKLHDEIQYRTNSGHFSTPTDSPSDRGSLGKQCTDYQHRNEQEWMTLAHWSTYLDVLPSARKKWRKISNFWTIDAYLQDFRIHNEFDNSTRLVDWTRMFTIPQLLTSRILKVR